MAGKKKHKDNYGVMLMVMIGAGFQKLDNYVQGRTPANRTVNKANKEITNPSTFSPSLHLKSNGTTGEDRSSSFVLLFVLLLPKSKPKYRRSQAELSRRPLEFLLRLVEAMRSSGL